MKMDELNFKETGLISILRAFKFLHEYNYQEKEISMIGRGNPSIVYHNNFINRIINIIGDESVSWSVVIQRKKLLTSKRDYFAFDISDYYEFFNCSMIRNRNYTLNAQSEFIRSNLLPIIKGEMWIDELIKLKGF